MTYFLLQIPQNVDVGDTDQVPIWQSPEHLAMGLVVLVLILFLVFVAKRALQKRNELNEDEQS